MHQVEALDGCLQGAGEADGAGVVHQNVDAAEVPDGLFDGARNCSSERMSTVQRQGLASGGFDFGGGGVDGARQFGMRLSVFAAMTILAPSRAARRAMA